MRRAVLLIAVSGLLCGTVTASPAIAAPPDDDCPAAVAASAIVPGLTGTGFSVVEGTTRETFSVEVLGVLDDALAPGRDLVVVSLAGPVIDRAGGSWAGMSGSPVFVGDRLLGALSYTMSPSAPIAGLTPGSDLLDLLADAPTVVPTRVPLDRRTAQAVASATQRPATEVARAGLTSMPLPLAVSGFSTPRMEELRTAIADRGLPLVPYAAASGSLGALATSGTTVRPGDNLAAVLSYGDVTAAATGAATVRCGDLLLGFGHPMLHEGATTLGASTGTSIALVPDPVWGSFELVRIGELVGTVDQDRFAGIRVDTSRRPDASVVTATVRDLDRGRTRTGRTDVVKRDWMPDLAFSHVLSNIDTVIDRVPGRGSSTVDVTVQGEGTGGVPFTYRRSNAFASPSDVSYESVLELYSDLAILVSSGIVDAEVTSVDVRASVGAEVRRYTIDTLEFATDGGPYTPLDGLPEVLLPAGGVLQVRVTLDPGARGTPVVAELALEIPADLSGPAALEVRGGPGTFVDPWQCIYDPQACVVDGAVDDVADLVAALAARPRNDDLVVALSTFDEGLPPEGEVVPDVVEAAQADGVATGPASVEVRERQDRVVSGFFGIPAYVTPSGSDVGGVSLRRVAGSDRIETAIALSQDAFPAPGTAYTVVLARADDPADALAGAPLAASLGVPLLLTWGDRLPDTVAAELGRLGATEVIVLGGSGAVSDTVVESLTDLGITAVERLAGTDRYDTARLVALRVGGDRVLLARGDGDAADAVSAAALGAQQLSPLLLTGGGALPEPTLAALGDLGVAHVRIVGGPAAVPAAVEDALVAAGLSVERIAGSDRYATAAALARTAVAEGADPSQVVVATGRAYPDALVAGAYTGVRGGVLLLVEGRDPAGSAAAQELLAELAIANLGVTITIVGGTGAVSDAAAADLLAAAQAASGQSALASVPR